MARLNLDLWTFDVGTPASTPNEFAELVIDRVLLSWGEGADVVVFPEFTWMGLERFIPGPAKLTGVAGLFWNDLWPLILSGLNRKDKAVVLGSVPFLDDTGCLRNRAPILSEGRVCHQDKIHLTPWESEFRGGGPLRIWRYRGYKLAVVICLDVEIPELSAALRGQDLDLMLVPSATESLLGVERVGRCADARAVELGCYVGLCHLVGRAESALVDENIGRLAVFAPSQSAFSSINRHAAGDLIVDGFHRESVVLEMNALLESRTTRGETDPSRVRPAGILLEIA